MLNLPAHQNSLCAVGMICILACAPAAFSAPTDAGPASQPATTSAGTQPKAAFESGDAIGGYLNAMALQFQVIVIRPEKMEAVILKKTELPAGLDDAVDLLQNTLAAQGLGVIKTVSRQGQVVLKLVTSKEKEEADKYLAVVTSGADATRIDVSKPDQLATHLLPIQHAEMLDALKTIASKDKDIELTVAGAANSGYQMIITGPAKKVRAAVTAVIKVDGEADAPTATRVVTLLNMDAGQAAARLNQGFAPGSGMRATADPRTNTVIITGPENKVTESAATLIEMDGAGRFRRPSRQGGRGPEMPGTLDAALASGENTRLNFWQECAFG